MSILVLVRHGQSQWNQQNLFTGWRDPDLTENGVNEAHLAGVKLKELKFDLAFTSLLGRANRTLDIILDEIKQVEIPTTKDQALNERDYGDLAGMDKTEAREKFGEEQVHIWRRSYDIAPPNGESLKDTADRAIPYFNAKILPKLQAGKNILIVAHGNSLRALTMQLENLSSEEITKVEIATGVPIVYELDLVGKVSKKNILE